jgi:hypothetical protein
MKKMIIKPHISNQEEKIFVYNERKRKKIEWSQSYSCVFLCDFLNLEITIFNRVLVKQLPKIGESTPKIGGRQNYHVSTAQRPKGSWSSNSSWEMGVGKIILKIFNLNFSCDPGGSRSAKNSAESGSQSL